MKLLLKNLNYTGAYTEAFKATKPDLKTLATLSQAKLSSDLAQSTSRAPLQYEINMYRENGTLDAWNNKTVAAEIEALRKEIKQKYISKKSQMKFNQFLENLINNDHPYIVPALFNNPPAEFASFMSGSDLQQMLCLAHFDIAISLILEQNQKGYIDALASSTAEFDVGHNTGKNCLYYVLVSLARYTPHRIAAVIFSQNETILKNISSLFLETAIDKDPRWADIIMKHRPQLLEVMLGETDHLNAGAREAFLEGLIKIHRVEEQVGEPMAATWQNIIHTDLATGKQTKEFRVLEWMPPIMIVNGEHTLIQVNKVLNTLNNINLIKTLQDSLFNPKFLERLSRRRDLPLTDSQLAILPKQLWSAPLVTVAAAIADPKTAVDKPAASTVTNITTMAETEVVATQTPSAGSASGASAVSVTTVMRTSPTAPPILYMANAAGNGAVNQTEAANLQALSAAPVATGMALGK